MDWIDYINFNSTSDNSRAEEDKNQELWRVIKLVLFYNIEDVANKEERDLNNEPDLIPNNIKVHSINFTEFLLEALRIMHKDREKKLSDPLFLNEGNIIHMVTELGHVDMLGSCSKYLISINTPNGKFKTPFHIAIDK